LKPCWRENWEVSEDRIVEGEEVSDNPGGDKKPGRAVRVTELTQ